jgi:hypothetical protein
MRMRSFILVLSSVFALGACGSKTDDAIAGLKKYKDKMCACSDKECAEGVDKEMRDWRKDMKKDMKGEDKPSESVMKEIMEIQSEYQACYGKSRKGGADKKDEKKEEKKEEKK